MQTLMTKIEAGKRPREILRNLSKKRTQGRGGEIREKSGTPYNYFVHYSQP